MPEWLDQVTFGEVWETIVWAGAVVGGAWWVWRRVKPLLLRIEAKADSADAKAEKAVANTQPNGGESPHDQLMGKVDDLQQSVGKVDDLQQSVDYLMAELRRNHPPEDTPRS